jgi:hypothetical protein
LKDIPSQRQIETTRDVFLDEETVFQILIESQMDIDNETIPSPPSSIQRETDITLGYPRSLVDMFIDIAVRHKIPT